MTTYADTYAALNRAVQTRAVSVVIDTDMGEVTLTPAEALAAFDDIAPGEGFTLVSVTERDLPAGITGFDPIEHGERRWNGAVWTPLQVGYYNLELKRIETRHNAGLDVQHLVNGLYNLADGFDRVSKP